MKKRNTLSELVLIFRVPKRHHGNEPFMLNFRPDYFNISEYKNFLNCEELINTGFGTYNKFSDLPGFEEFENARYPIRRVIYRIMK
ncbi:hypothetical protein HYU23_02685 [Candidatus Woesearchaeota archaeon]|nr:hypothetical protein [Candidatus Woesearchaeota archaeon]